MSLFIAALAATIALSSYVAIGTIGFTLQFATTKVLNLAYGDILALSAYCAYTLRVHGANLWLAGAAAVLVGCVGSLILSRALLLPAASRGMGFAGLSLLTLGVSYCLENLINMVWDPEDKSFGIASNNFVKIGSFQWSTQETIAVAAAVVVIIGMDVLVRRSRLGRLMRAVASNDELARACGVPASRIVLIAWAISGALCGLTGVLLGTISVEFNASTGFAFVIVVLASAFLGGIGNVYGAVIGAFLVSLVSQVGAAYSNPSFTEPIVFGLLVVVLLVRPRGLFYDQSVQREIAR